MEKYKKVYFEWADTTSPVDKTWMSENESIQWAEEDNYFVKQVGFLIKKTKKYTLLAGHINITQTAGQEIISLGHLIKIPNTWIKNYKIIR